MNKKITKEQRNAILKYAKKFVKATDRDAFIRIYKNWEQVAEVEGLEEEELAAKLGIDVRSDVYAEMKKILQKTIFNVVCESFYDDDRIPDGVYNDDDEDCDWQRQNDWENGEF